MGCFDKVAELLFDFFAKLGVVAQEIACVFPALSDADIAVGEPCAGLCDDLFATPISRMEPSLETPSP